MTSTLHATLTTTDPPPDDAAESLGARLARLSRQAQGLALGVSDPAVLAGLRELCAAPRPARRGQGIEPPTPPRGGVG